MTSGYIQSGNSAEFYFWHAAFGVGVRFPKQAILLLKANLGISQVGHTICLLCKVQNWGGCKKAAREYMPLSKTPGPSNELMIWSNLWLIKSFRNKQLFCISAKGEGQCIIYYSPSQKFKSIWISPKSCPHRWLQVSCHILPTIPTTLTL